MNEPLKGKEGYVQFWEIVDLDKIRECNHTAKVFEAEDVKSAVEWLKSKLTETEMLTDETGAYIPNSLDTPTVLGIIDKAFEDVALNSVKATGDKDE